MHFFNKGRRRRGRRRRKKEKKEDNDDKEVEEENKEEGEREGEINEAIFLLVFVWSYDYFIHTCRLVTKLNLCASFLSLTCSVCTCSCQVLKCEIALPVLG